MITFPVAVETFIADQEKRAGRKFDDFQRELLGEYYQVVEEHRRLLALKKALAPNRDAADYIHPLYAEAVKRLPYLEWWLEENIEMGR